MGWSRLPQGKGKPGHGASQTCLPTSRISQGAGGGARSALRSRDQEDSPSFHSEVVTAAPCSRKNPGSKSLLKRLKNSAPNPLLPQTKNSRLYYSPSPLRPKSLGPQLPPTVRPRSPESQSLLPQTQSPESQPPLPDPESGPQDPSFLRPRSSDAQPLPPLNPESRSPAYPPPSPPSPPSEPVVRVPSPF